MSDISAGLYRVTTGNTLIWQGRALQAGSVLYLNSRAASQLLSLGKVEPVANSGGVLPPDQPPTPPSPGYSFLIPPAAVSTNVDVPAGGRKNVQFGLGLPDGYVVAAFRQILLSGTNFQTCSIQSFGTSGGGTKANINIYNGGSADAKISVSCVVFAYKQV